MPFAARQNPNLADARTHTRAWAEHMGMLASGVWSPASFERDDIPLRAAYLGPDADPAELKLRSDWCTWALFVNDYCLELFKRRRDLIGAKAFAGRLGCFVAPDSLALAPSNPAERALADLWQRSAMVMAPGPRRLLADRTRAYAESAVWEIFNTIQDRVPDPIDYCEMRRVTGRGELALSLVVLRAEPPLPAAVMRDRFVTQLREAFCDVMPLRNDILSYAKELGSEGEMLNGVVVMQRFFDCDPTRAMAITNALITARIEQFEHVAANSLPELFDELELDEGGRAQVRSWVGRLESWMAGDLAWSRLTGRYGEWPGPRVAIDERPPGSPLSMPAPPVALAPLLRAMQGPSGLGTSAARVHAALRRAMPDATATPAAPTTSLDEKLREIARRARGTTGP